MVLMPEKPDQKRKKMLKWCTLYTPFFFFFSPSTISLVVSVDVNNHFYLLKW